MGWSHLSPSWRATQERNKDLVQLRRSFKAGHQENGFWRGRASEDMQDQVSESACRWSWCRCLDKAVRAPQPVKPARVSCHVAETPGGNTPRSSPTGWALLSRHSPLQPRRAWFSRRAEKTNWGSKSRKVCCAWRRA